MTRNVVISGGGTGIGLAAARMFAADGDQVLLIGRRRGVLERAGVPGARTFAADFAAPGAVGPAAPFVGRGFGAVDLRIHGAAGKGLRGPPAGATTRWTPSPGTGRSTSGSMC